MAASLAHLAIALEGVLTTTPKGLANPLAVGPGRQGLGSANDAAAWRQLAPALDQPQLLLLAISEELRPLAASLHSLNLIRATLQAPAAVKAPSTSQPPWGLPGVAGSPLVSGLARPLSPARGPSGQPQAPQHPGPQQPGPPAPC
jgi:hypothetical protein